MAPESIGRRGRSGGFTMEGRGMGAPMATLVSVLIWAAAVTQSQAAPPPPRRLPPLSTKHPPPSTKHPPPSTKHPPPSTKHPPPSMKHPPPSMKHPPPSMKHPPPSMKHPPPTKKHPPPPRKRPPPPAKRRPPPPARKTPSAVQKKPPPPLKRPASASPTPKKPPPTKPPPPPQKPPSPRPSPPPTTTQSSPPLAGILPPTTTPLPPPLPPTLPSPLPGQAGPPPSDPFDADCIFTLEGQADATLCAVGFAAGTTGGKMSQYFVVTTAVFSGSVAGSLAQVVYGAPSGRYVTFSENMYIDTGGAAVYFREGTTLDARGVDVTVKCSEMNLYSLGYNKNLIFLNINFVFTQSVAAYGTNAQFASNLYFDHCSFNSASSSTRSVAIMKLTHSVTFANCRFSSMGLALIIGGDGNVGQDAAINVTLYRNLFEGGDGYQVEAWYGFVDAVNNLFLDYGVAAVAPKYGARFRSASNVYWSSRSALAVDPAAVSAYPPLPAAVVSVDDWLKGGASLAQSLVSEIPSAPAYVAALDLRPASPTLEEYVNMNAGPYAVAYVEEEEPQE